MDEFKDFFKELKERISSPFLGSFIISWCLINWPILLAVLFKNDEKKSDRFTFVYDTIVKHDNFFSFFLFPVACAIVYTFGYPYVRRLIKWHIATQTAKSDSAILKSTGIASVSLNNYLIMKEAQEASQEKLSGLINAQQSVLSGQEKLKDDLNKEQIKSLELQQALAMVQSEVNEKQRFDRMSNYYGTWTVVENNRSISSFWQINDGVIEIGNHKTAHIISFLADFDQRLIAFQLHTKIVQLTTDHDVKPSGMSINSINEARKNAERVVDQVETFVFKVSNDLNYLNFVTLDNSSKKQLSRLI